MIQKVIYKKLSPKKKSELQSRHFGLHSKSKSKSKSKDKSSSGDDNKNQISSKRVSYKHEIFDKTKAQKNFKSSQTYKENAQHIIDVQNYSNQNTENEIKQSGIVNDQIMKTPEKLRKEESIEIKSKQLSPIKQEYNKSGLKSLQRIQESQSNRAEDFQNKTEEVPYQIKTIQNPCADREDDILRHKYESNLKFLQSQTNQLMSFNRHMLAEEQTIETKKNISELNIYIRRLRIEMRNHEYTKQINFTFPVEKHNDEILVKMPEAVQDRQMKKYELLLQRIANQKKAQSDLAQKIQNLDAYYESLLKKYQPVLSYRQDSEASKIKSSVFSIENKLNKSKSAEMMSGKSSSNLSSLQSSNASKGNKNLQSKIGSDKVYHNGLVEKRFLTAKQKRNNLSQTLKQCVNSINQKIKRLQQEISLLKKQIDLVDCNLKNVDQNKYILNQQIEKAKTRKSESSQQQVQGFQKQYQTVLNSRKNIYEKQKNQRNIEKNGFTFMLRQNKSLSPSNYISTSSNKLIGNSTKTKHNPQIKLKS